MVCIQRALKLVGRTITLENLGTHVVFGEEMGRAPAAAGPRLLEYIGDGILEAIICSSFPRQTAVFYSSAVNNKTLAEGAMQSRFLNLLRCMGRPSYSSPQDAIKAKGDAVEVAVGSLLNGEDWTSVDLLEMYPAAVNFGLGGELVSTSPP